MAVLNCSFPTWQVLNFLLSLISFHATEVERNVSEGNMTDRGRLRDNGPITSPRKTLRRQCFLCHIVSLCGCCPLFTVSLQLFCIALFVGSIYVCFMLLCGHFESLPG